MWKFYTSITSELELERIDYDVNINKQVKASRNAEAGRMKPRSPLSMTEGASMFHRNNYPACLHEYLQMIDLTVTGLNGVQVPENK